jgi:hypothetical protein
VNQHKVIAVTTSVDILSVDCRREVRAAHSAVHQTIIDALRTAGFSVDRIEGNTVLAHRGWSFAPRFGERIKGAVQARAMIVDFRSAVRVSLHLSEAEQLLFDLEQAKERYRNAFAEVVGAVDAALAALDPTVRTEDAPALTVAPEASSARQQFGRIGGRFGRPAAPGTDRIRLLAGADEAALEASQLQAVATVAGMALTDPTIPPSLLEPAQRIHEVFLRPPATVLELSDAERRVLDFLHHQAAVRQSLPIRELCRCRDCGQHRIENPDYQKTLAKNRNLQDAVGGLTSALVLGPMGAFGIAGRLLGARGTGFVCHQCQGTNADVSLITICPQCRRMSPQPILRVCPEATCGYAFAERATAGIAWHPRGHHDALAPAAPPVAEVSPVTRGLERATALQDKVSQQLGTGMTMARRLINRDSR